MSPKSNDVSKIDLSFPDGMAGQLRSVEVSPSMQFGEVKIDTNQQRSAPTHLGRQESAFHTTGKGE